MSKELVFTADLAAMIAARDAIMDWLQDTWCSEGDRTDILVALQEALANAVVHGCHSDPSKAIDCRVDVDPSAITITVRDPGEGFHVAATEAAGTNLSEHGRGIQMMRGLMDEVTFRRGGSEVGLVKLRSGAGAAALP